MPILVNGYQCTKLKYVSPTTPFEHSVNRLLILEAIQESEDVRMPGFIHKRVYSQLPA